MTRYCRYKNRTCRVYGTVGAEYLLLQMADEHDPAGMERGSGSPATANHTTIFAGRCPRGKLERRPVALVRTARVGRSRASAAGAEDTLAWLEQADAEHPSTVFYKGKIAKVLFGRLLAGGAVCTVGGNPDDTLYGVAAASPSVWFPGWPEYEAAHPIQTQRVYLSLGDREEHTKNQTMAAVG